ncbi:anthranilate synthase component II [Mangrovicoccus ximenensis]|uniref:anthranilate synthase component II n=1 Tax=Mangrovicoccus ximenensis TaxID=1911570 RepID=UPI002ED58CD3
MILLLDNHDSFTHNVARYCAELGHDVRVVLSDRIALAEIEAMAPAALIVSPGPGRPEDAGVSMAAIRRFSGRLPILGVCLGHQAIGAAFGGRPRPCRAGPRRGARAAGALRLRQRHGLPVPARRLGKGDRRKPARRRKPL